MKLALTTNTASYQSTETMAQNTKFPPLIPDEMLAVTAPKKEVESFNRSSGIPSYDIRRFENDPFIMPHRSHWDDVDCIFQQEKSNLMYVLR